MQNQQYTNGVLTAIAALLGLHLVGLTPHRGTDVGSAIATATAAQPEAYRRDGAAERPASHSDPTEGGLISAAEQRKLMLVELRELNARLTSIESTLSTGVSVSVTDMPEINWPAQADATEAGSAPAGTP